MLLRACVALAALLLAACDGEKVDYSNSDRYDITWLWLDGTGLNTDSAHGTLNVADAANSPGARDGAVTWVDGDGVVWLFGGRGDDDSGDGGDFNDLWTYDGVDWTWVAGPDTVDGAADYGTQGVAAATNIPGARTNSLGWIDGDGNLWLFGGDGLDANGDNGPLNDLWKFDVATKEWTWVAGSTLRNSAGTYGTLETPDANNTPGGRHSAAGWRDSAGNFWLFGGYGRDGSGDCCFLNDVWKFDVDLQQWAWMKGPDVASTASLFGDAAQSGPTYTPGGRYGAVAWHKANDEVWLFGGKGVDGEGNPTVFNEMWRYDVDPDSDTYNNWAWVSGTQDAFSAGDYGGRGAVTIGATPPGRTHAVGWTDTAGTLWLFGGAVEAEANDITYPNDLWYFAGGYWVWMGGSALTTADGSYVAVGERGQPAGRAQATGWYDAELNALWLYGGAGLDESDIWRVRDDVWVYTP